MLLVAAAAVPYMLWSPQGIARLSAMAQQRRQLDLEIDQLTREIERLRVVAREIKTSPASVERVARDQLGLVRQTELVVQFPAD